MHHATGEVCALLAHDAQGVLCRRARMNDQGQRASSRRLDMTPETLALPLKIARQTKIVQPGFPNRDNPRMR